MYKTVFHNIFAYANIHYVTYVTLCQFRIIYIYLMWHACWNRTVRGLMGVRTDLAEQSCWSHHDK